MKAHSRGFYLKMGSKIEPIQRIKHTKVTQMASFNQEIIKQQTDICLKYGAANSPVDTLHKVGISKEICKRRFPINGLRHPPINDTSGWYIWFGIDPPTEEGDYFDPMHISHLLDYCPEVIPYLALSPGWRFLITPEYEDVWFDKNLLYIE